MDMLKLSNRNLKQTIPLITHDENIALEADRIVTIEDGRIIRDQKRVADNVERLFCGVYQKQPCIQYIHHGGRFYIQFVLSFLCKMFYNVWVYEVEKIVLEEGDWQGRLTGVTDAGTYSQ